MTEEPTAPAGALWRVEFRQRKRPAQGASMWSWKPTKDEAIADVIQRMRSTDPNVDLYDLERPIVTVPPPKPPARPTS
jgi:hypothetical protein